MWYKSSSSLLQPYDQCWTRPREGAGLWWQLLSSMGRVISPGQFSPAHTWYIFRRCLFPHWLAREPLIIALTGYHLQTKQTLQYLCRSVLLIASILHSIFLQSLCPHLSWFPSPRLGNPTRHSTSSAASTLFGQAKLITVWRGSHTFLLLPNHGAAERALPVLGKWYNYVQYLISACTVSSPQLFKRHNTTSSLTTAPDHSL